MQAAWLAADMAAAGSISAKRIQLAGWPDAAPLPGWQLAAQLHHMPAAHAQLRPQQDGTSGVHRIHGGYQAQQQQTHGYMFGLEQPRGRRTRPGPLLAHSRSG